MIFNPHDVAKRLVPLIDLTSLNTADNDLVIKNLCEMAKTPVGNVAAVCIYAPFVKLAKQLLRNSGIKVATVCNFPLGTQDVDSTVAEIEQAIIDGAEEIDMVMPFRDYITGARAATQFYIKACKDACGREILLKVILETGALKNPRMIATATFDVLNAGADFVKTSTGKISVGATIDAARAMLLTINELSPGLLRPVGFKASGGVRTIEEAASYLQLADEIMGSAWVSPQTFRIGASSLLNEILQLERQEK